MRAYHRIDPLMDERKSDYTPAQLGAYLKVQLLAGRQKQRGVFRSRPALMGALPSAYARHVPFLIEQHDLLERADGTIYVDGWDEWQEGDLTVRERMARLRNRHRNAGRNNDVTQPSPTANAIDSLASTLGPLSRTSVSISAGASLSDEEQREHLDRLKAVLSEHGIVPATRGDASRRKPAETDEQVIARCRAIVSDDDAPAWKRDAANEQLKLMGAHS